MFPNFQHKLNSLNLNRIHPIIAKFIQQTVQPALTFGKIPEKWYQCSLSKPLFYWLSLHCIMQRNTYKLNVWTRMLAARMAWAAVIMSWPHWHIHKSISVTETTNIATWNDITLATITKPINSTYTVSGTSD